MRGTPRAQFALTDNDNNNSLILAARHGHVDIVKIIAHDMVPEFNLDHRNHRGLTATEEAFAHNHIEIAFYLLTRELVYAIIHNSLGQFRTKLHAIRAYNALSLFNEAHYQGQTALTAAAKFGRLAMLNELLDAQVDINGYNGQGETALMEASRYGKAAIVSGLIQRKANLNFHNGRMKTAFQIAEQEGHFDIMNLLKNAQLFQAIHDQDYHALAEFAEDYSFNITNSDGYSPLCFAVLQKSSLLVSQLLAYGAPIFLRDAHGQTAKDLALEKAKEDPNYEQIVLVLKKEEFIHAARMGVLAFVQRQLAVLNPGYWLQSSNHLGNTALIEAAKHGHAAMVDYLINRGANVCQLNEQQKSADQEARNAGQLGIANVLLDHKKAKFLEAATRGHLSTVNSYLQSCFNVEQNQHDTVALEVTDSEGNTALLLATRAGHPEIVAALLEAGVNTEHHNQNQVPKNAEQIALERDTTPHRKILKLLRTATFVKAIDAGNIDLIQSCLLYDVNPNELSKSGKTALIVAIEARDEEAVTFLLRKGAEVMIKPPVHHRNAKRFALEYLNRDSPIINLLQKAEFTEAARKGMWDFVNKTLAQVTQKTALANTTDYLGNTALHYAVGTNKLTMTCILLSFSDISIRNKKEMSVLSLAHRYGSPDIKTRVEQHEESMLFIKACGEPQSLSFVENYIRAYGDQACRINYKDRFGYTAYLTARVLGNLPALTLLLGCDSTDTYLKMPEQHHNPLSENRVSIEMHRLVWEFRQRLLLTSAARGDMEGIESYLKEHSLAQTPGKDEVLYLAALHGHRAIVKRLLKEDLTADIFSPMALRRAEQAAVSENHFNTANLIAAFPRFKARGIAAQQQGLSFATRLKNIGCKDDPKDVDPLTASAMDDPIKIEFLHQSAWCTYNRSSLHSYFNFHNKNELPCVQTANTVHRTDLMRPRDETIYQRTKTFVQDKELAFEISLATRRRALMGDIRRQGGVFFSHEKQEHDQASQEAITATKGTAP